MKLNELKPAPGATHSTKRLGRGRASGTGKTSGRGHGGYGSRSGSKKRAWFEGGQMPIQRRVPKRGFTNIFRVEFQIVNVSQLARLSEDITEVNPDVLFANGMVSKRNQPVKLLGEGTVERSFQIHVDKCSAKARELIESAGGSVTTVEG
ncbi:MAG: 50S ribosomal protein L15 [Candidatus Krumholzibacteria bacterium]|jgi:large subunit ribosomal protein L15|nr:50S ribosomal protein L15 [Candidatus Krumholzibacteria bacterium]MDP6670022.1 50S ribosomal protein L15 [Candidatus Krumholzibacteria bacterium]MDP6797139.1 50S ribosomal protein L15 [Candidatus Krumholzibacteria bacterium]MDP7022055.1 50S ribosomal protein L15 [Candidatus Krumholzibacteria bacterium]